MFTKMNVSKDLVEAAKKVMDEAELEETGLRKAAHAAREAGQSQFMFKGKRYPVTAMKEDVNLDEAESEKPRSAFDWKNTKSQLPTKPGEKAGFDSKKISTGTVYSRKATKEEVELDEAGQGDLLDQFIRARGRNPETMSMDQKVSFAKMGNFIQWKRQHEEVVSEKIDRTQKTTDTLAGRVVGGKENDHGPSPKVKFTNEEEKDEKEKSNSPFDWKNKKSELPTKPGEKAGFDSKKISTGTVYSRKATKEEVESLDELKKSTLASYAKKATDDVSYHSFSAGTRSATDPERLKDDKKAMNRQAGVNRAVDRLAKEEDESNKTHSDRDVKMAIGIINDKRYKGSNLTGAVKAIDKMKPGLSDHPAVKRAMRTANEEYELNEKNESHTHAAHYENDKGEWTGMNLLVAKSDDDAIKQAHEKCKEGCRLSRVERHIPVKEEYELDESFKTTHENPLVTVHDKNGLHTHANLSVANDIFGTNVKHSDVHKGEVKTKSRAGDVRFNISKHHQTAMKEEVESLDELSPATHQAYRKAAGAQASALDKQAAKHYASGNVKVGKELTQKANKRFSGIVKSTVKESESLDEREFTGAEVKRQHEIGKELEKKGVGSGKGSGYKIAAWMIKKKPAAAKKAEKTIEKKKK
jgi:hypothetical protein